MLIVAAKGREREVVDIFKKWELDAVVIGHVTADGHLRVKETIDHATFPTRRSQTKPRSITVL